MPMIRETIVTTVDGEGKIHIAPLGIIAEGERWILAPFRPSKTLDNLRAVPFAVANHTDDVRIYAGCLTGRRDWATIACEETPAPRLKDCLAHMSLRVVEVGEDEMRPRFQCEVVRSVSHAPFAGFNRAQAAVIEAAILASRLHLLPREKIEREIAALEIVVGKTAGPNEQTAWNWLRGKFDAYFGAIDAGTS
ncbi:MAG TPA: DUF447 domain-containing protein [Roseiarcus sp.]|jgi:hypothetical protein